MSLSATHYCRVDSVPLLMDSLLPSCVSLYLRTRGCEALVSCTTMSTLRVSIVMVNIEPRYFILLKVTLKQTTTAACPIHFNITLIKKQHNSLLSCHQNMFRLKESMRYLNISTKKHQQHHISLLNSFLIITIKLD